MREKPFFWASEVCRELDISRRTFAIWTKMKILETVKLPGFKRKKVVPRWSLVAVKGQLETGALLRKAT